MSSGVTGACFWKVLSIAVSLIVKKTGKITTVLFETRGCIKKEISDERDSVEKRQDKSGTQRVNIVGSTPTRPTMNVIFSRGGM